MSDQVKVGDLVYVAKPCCDFYAGMMFVVEKIFPPEAWMVPACQFCGHMPTDKLFACGAPPPALPLSMLKRIPPLADLQTYRNTDENPVDPVFDSALDIMSGKVNA